MSSELIPLRAGPLALWFQPNDARLRHISAGGVELIRGIVAPIRDASWRTAPIRIENLHIARGADHFHINFDAHSRSPGIDYRWRGEFIGNANGEILARFSGRARCEFFSNRIGFCVLHPAEAAARQFVAEHTDGRRTRGRLPEQISPHQPLRDLRALTVEHAPGLITSVRFTGDTFEMEDQRNWLDASFKTYCTPLDRPHPVLVRPGDRVEQSVHLALLHAGTVPWVEPAAPPLSAPPRPAPNQPRPALGLAWPRDDSSPLSPHQRGPLRKLGLAHLRVDIRADDAGAMRAAETGLAEAAHAGLPVELAVHIDEANATATETWVRAHRGEVARWIVVARGRPALTETRWPTELRTWCRSDASAPIVGGSDLEFTELNRNHPPTAALDGVNFGCTPQTHASDERSIRETLSMIPLVVAQAKRIGGELPVHVGPITFHPAGRCTLREDPRLDDALGCEWTHAAIDALTAGGVASATFYTVRGVLASPTLAAVFQQRCHAG